MIGVFDSGFGGLEILRAFVKKIPQYSYCYLGDNQRAPYGPKSQKTIYDFTRQGVEFLLKRGCKLVILACNTASSEALRKIQQEFLPKHYPDKRVLGVVVPACQTAAILTKNKKIGVIGTTGTVSSNAFVKELNKIDKAIRVFQTACPLLVPLIERGEENSLLTEIYLKQRLSPLLSKNIDILILGCTHYGLIDKKIKKIVGANIKVVSEGKIIAEKLKDYLKRHPAIEKRLSRKQSVRFFTTGSTKNFALLGGRFFGKPLKSDQVALK